MLTRLKVKGFKNLVDVDVWFGPFTCIAGANGVGKSNLFDAITFLSALADRPLMDAALSVRDEGGRTGDIRSLFNHVGNDLAEEMSFEADMIIPERGFDDLAQEAKASSTFVSYAISLRYRQDSGPHSLGSLELTREELSYIKLKVNEAKSAVARPQERKFLGFSFTDGPEIKRTIAPKALAVQNADSGDHATGKERRHDDDNGGAGTHAGLAKLFRILRNAKGADRLNPLGPVATQVGFVAAVENTAPSPGGSFGTRGSSTTGKQYCW